MKKYIYLLSFILILFSCKDENTKPIPPTPSDFEFAKGADISWVTEMEKDGIKFYNKNGEERECTALMKELGMNSIRLRVWVDPIDGWCGKEDVLVKARRAKKLGMRLMIDFHYSDWWADPGKQNKPEAWKDLDFKGLKQAVSDHTEDILSALKEENIYPEWVQVGNETPNGMLWEDGRASEHMDQYAELNNAGYDAIKKIFPDAKAVVHIDNGFDKGRFEWIFNGLKENKGKWDVIGMSLYPDKNDWLAKTSACIENVKNMISLYDTDVIICEVGMSWDEAEICKSFLTELISKAKAIPENRCLGVMYWEPEASPNWKDYKKGAFSENWRPTVALDAFKN